MILSHYENKKQGPVILFIHGTASANEMWEEQYEILNKSHYRVIGVDLRGHGKSKDPGGIGTMQDHVNDLKETLGYLQISEPIIIIGHSFGAVLAMKLAEQYPHLVMKLLLVSLPARIPKLLLQYYRWFLGKPIEYLKKKVHLLLKLPLKKRHKFAFTTEINVIRQIWRESLNWDFVTQVPRLNCPVYLSVGRFDYVALKSMVRKLHNELPNSTYTIFNWSSHVCMEDEPREFNKWVLAALALPLIHI